MYAPGYLFNNRQEVYTGGIYRKICMVNYSLLFHCDKDAFYL